MIRKRHNDGSGIADQMELVVNMNAKSSAMSRRESHASQLAKHFTARQKMESIKKSSTPMGRLPSILNNKAENADCLPTPASNL